MGALSHKLYALLLSHLPFWHGKPHQTYFGIHRLYPPETILAHQIPLDNHLHWMEGSDFHPDPEERFPEPLHSHPSTRSLVRKCGNEFPLDSSSIQITILSLPRWHPSHLPRHSEPSIQNVSSPFHPDKPALLR